MLNISQTFNKETYQCNYTHSTFKNHLLYQHLISRDLLPMSNLSFLAKCQTQEAWKHWQQFGALIAEDRAERTQRSSEEAHIED